MHIKRRGSAIVRFLGVVGCFSLLAVIKCKSYLKLIRLNIKDQ